jgi:formate dehydrogenase alpha subunit
MTNSIDGIAGSDCILVMGSNTTCNHPMIASKIMKAKKKGAKLIVIDTRRIPLCQYADLFLQLKPGTLIALLNGMIRILIEKGLVDEAFVRDRTEGFDDIKVKVGEFTSEKVSEITGIGPALLERAAAMYARARNGSILYCLGVTQHTTGTDNVKAVANLAMAAGHIGRPGTGVNPLRGQNNVQGACDMGALPNVLTGYQPVADPSVRDRFGQHWGLPVPETPGITVVEMIDAAARGAIKAMYIVGENPMLTDPDTGYVRKALDALQFLVVQDIFLTETAKLADVVLPACSFAEKEGTFTNTDRRVQRVRKAIEPVGESKPDWLIVSELAQRMGYDNFTYDSPERIFQEIRALTPSYAGITYDRLDRGEVLHWPCPNEEHAGTPILHQAQFTRGRGKFFALDYAPPHELPDSDFPFLLTTGRIPFHYHSGSMTRRIERLNQEAPTGFAVIHPADARNLQVENGQTISVTSRRGNISIIAQVSDEIEPGMVFIPMHFAECAANVLTDASRLDPVSKIPDYKVCAVKIEKLG